jgi:hypothetical protein
MSHQFIEVILRFMGPCHFVLFQIEDHRHEEANHHFSSDLLRFDFYSFEDQLDLGPSCTDFRI